MIPYEVRKLVYEKAIDHYGVDCQIWKAVEEMSELTKELAKTQTSTDTDRDRLVDEIADVTVMVEQLSLIIDANEDVRNRMDYKIQRLAQRMGA